jgi:hypothetical protein
MIVNKSSVQITYLKAYDLVNKEVFFPIFQRGFSWKPIQTEKILEDILNNINQEQKDIYLLDFIWFEEEGIFKLADGQQRLVTLFIIIMCINEIIEEKQISIEKIKNFSIFYDEETNQQKYSRFKEGDIVAPYKKVYLFIRDFVSKNAEQIQEIIKVVTSKIYVYLKKAENVDDAFEIFKQINTGGKPLSKDEIIKTIISQYSSKYGITMRSSDKDIRKLIISYHKYISGDTSGNFDTIGIMSFLNKEIVSSKSQFQKFANYLGLVNNINKLAIYHIINYINRSQLTDIVYILGIKGIDINSRREYLNRLLLPLCLLSIIMTIKKVNPGGIILTLYTSIIEKIKNDKSINDIEEILLKFIDDNKQICKISITDFAEGIGDSGLSQNIKKAILIMDIVRCNTSGSLNVESINVEHIYPKKPVTTWATSGWPVNRLEQEIIINNIGNLILLNQEINKRIQNRYIDDKIVEYQKIISKDTFLQTPINTVDFEKFKIQRGVYVNERQEFIAKAVQNDFYFGKVLITQVD